MGRTPESNARHEEFTKRCSGVGKEQDIIRNPRLLQLRRTVSRALGRVIEDSQVEVPAFLQ